MIQLLLWTVEVFCWSFKCPLRQPYLLHWPCLVWLMSAATELLRKSAVIPTSTTTTQGTTDYGNSNTGEQSAQVLLKGRVHPIMWLFKYLKIPESKYFWKIGKTNKSTGNQIMNTFSYNSNAIWGKMHPSQRNMS